MSETRRRRSEPEPAPPDEGDDIEIVSVDAVDEDGRLLAEETEDDQDADGPEFVEIELPDDDEGDRAEVAGMREQILRARADLENYRARVERDRVQVEDRARAAVIVELLPVLDDLDRALAAPADDGPIREGLELIARAFRERLAALGLRTIATEGVLFDPEVHEAAVTEERDDVAPHTVLGELRRGYRLGDRLLRPALVSVSLEPGEEGLS